MWKLVWNSQFSRSKPPARDSSLRSASHAGNSEIAVVLSTVPLDTREKIYSKSIC